MPWLAFLAALLILLIDAFAADLGPNLALRKPIEASDEVWASLSPASLTDGDANTFCHPRAATGTRGFYFEVDLGATFRLEEIRIRNRGDSCCPERLTRYRVELYADDGGEPGELAWGAEVRANGSHSGVSGVDVVKGSADAAGVFAGRFVRVVNASGLGYSPQLAEIEVYGGKPPTIRFLEAERDSVAAGEGTVLRWDAIDALGGVLQPGDFSVGAAGSLRIEPRETTRYTLTMTNAAGAVSAAVLIGVNVTLAPPRITEFLADNGSGLKDEDRDESDWIELYNPNEFSLNLEEFFLTDDPGSLRKWRFPSRRLPPGSYVIIFASGKDRTPLDGELHTNFRLAAEGEYLALVGSDGVAIQQFPADYPGALHFAPQLKDVSYGRGTNSVSGFMRPPTPGAPNGAAFAGAVAEATFRPPRGFYSSNLLVSLQTATPGATIRYSTNGSTPTATGGTVYTGPIPITGTMVLRAAAFRPGWSPTEVGTHTYIFPSNVVASTVMRTTITRHPQYAPHIVDGLLDLPSISLTAPEAINGTAEVRTSMEWIAPGGESLQADCGARHFGGAFTTFAKKNFRLYFRGRYGTPELRGRLFEQRGGGMAPVEEFNQLELRGGSHDMEQRGFYMSNIHADDTLLELKQLNPHGRFVHLYQNGVYWGVFHLRERWGAAMHQSYLGGARTNYESINGNWNVGGWAEPGVPYDGDGSAWARAKTLRNNFEAVKPLVDVEQYIDFMTVWMFGGSEDEYRAVGPAGPGSGFKFYINDADGWFCGPWYCAAGNRTARNSPGTANGDGPGSIFSMLFRQAHPEYRLLLADRIHQALFNGGPLTPAQNISRLNARTAEIERAFLAESARWNYLTPAQWQSRRDYALTNWLPRRTGEAINDFRAAGFYPSVSAPVFNRHGGKVDSGFVFQPTAARGLVFYTVDGSDPRLPGGGVSPRARTGMLALAENTLIRARARDGGIWSALNEAFFQADSEAGPRPGEFVISEINFDGGRTGTEFLELANVSERAVNLEGVKLAGGVRFDFKTARRTVLAPGQRLLLARDLLRFQARYGLELAWGGIYAGRLAREGEELLLTLGTNVLGRVSYGTSAPWPIAYEHTLVLWRPELGMDNPAAWRASAWPGGSPGAHEGTVFSGDPLADQDGDGRPALIEYAQGTSDSHPEAAPVSVEHSFGRLIVRVQRNLEADDLEVECEYTTDLRSWRPATFAQSEVFGAGLARDTWFTPPSAASATFIRVNVIRR